MNTKRRFTLVDIMRICFIILFYASNLIPSFAGPTNFAKTNFAGKTPPTKAIPATPVAKVIETSETAERYFYADNYEAAAKIFEPYAKNEKDRNYALWNTQLGSVYLAKGDIERASRNFLNAFYLMNNVTAFKELENKAMGLTGSEDKKAYKGDPYEKIYNSFYTGLLLYKQGDIENARAAFKNGILSGSDVSGELYKSNEPLLYLFASRMEFLSGDNSMGEAYLEQAKDAYCKTRPINRDTVSKEQFYRDQLKNNRDELNKLVKANTKKNKTFDKSKLSKKARKQFDMISNAMDESEQRVNGNVQEREKNNAAINTDGLKDFVKKDINTFLIIETGRGPIKQRAGKYGEMAIFRQEPDDIDAFKILIDGGSVNIQPVVADTYYQATTRGGRKMDAILKGKAHFKDESANTSKAMFNTSLSILEQANRNNPNNDPYVAGAYLAVAGACAIFGLGSAIVSSATNPAADIRHWGLLPGQIWVIPLRLSPGTHRIEIKPMNNNNPILPDQVKTLEVNINSKDSINFVRFPPYHAPIQSVKVQDNTQSNNRMGMVAAASYDNEAAAKEGVTDCATYGSKFMQASNFIPIKAIVDNGIREIAENLKTNQCSNPLQFNDGKFYVLKGVNNN